MAGVGPLPAKGNQGWPAWGSAGVLRAASLLSLVGVWVLLSHLLSKEVLPSPVDALEFLGREYRAGRLIRHVAVTMERVVLSFALSMVVGVTIGVAAGGSRVVDRLLEAWLVVGLTIPRIVVIVSAYLLVGLNDTAAIIAIAITVMPSVIVQLREGTQALDQGLVEMARAFKRPLRSIWRRVVIPQLLPYMMGTGRGAMSLTWKMVVFAELMGRTSGVGYQIAFYYQMFNMQGIIAYALAMVLVLAVIDVGLMRTVERMAFRWRRPVQLAGGN